MEDDIRPATAADAGALTELAACTFPLAGPIDGPAGVVDAPPCALDGAAAALTAARLDWIASKSRQPVRRGVTTENVHAQAFYRKHGFAVAGTRSFHLGSRIEHDYVMVRSTVEESDR